MQVLEHKIKWIKAYQEWKKTIIRCDKKKSEAPNVRDSFEVDGWGRWCQWKVTRSGGFLQSWDYWTSTA